ncbi:MAG TPA: glycosyl hydrolase, partial [bacterium]|nr:glycosyl hydrolase [bacterium]
RNQAHGSPGNLLDLYAASDIPETEGTEILRFKFASSAAHVTGKRLTSSESTTWLKEHFTASLADVKTVLDRFLLGGVNHIFYHGTPYSPPGEAWPGWLFYAAVNFSPTNSFWNDFSTLNAYVARCQSFLQSGHPENDVLLYFPIFDRYAERGRELLVHFDGREAVRDQSAFAASAQLLRDRGYAFDFISDRQLRQTEAAGGRLRTGGGVYQTIVVPTCRFIPLETFRKLLELAQNGATVIFYKNLPGDVPGLGNLENRQQSFQRLLGQIRFPDTDAGGIQLAKAGKGRIVLGEDLDRLLSTAGIWRESMVDHGLQYVRRRSGDSYYYFIVNGGATRFDGWMPLQVEAGSAALFDPMQHISGYARTRSSESGSIKVYMQMEPGESRIIRTFRDRKTGYWFPYYETSDPPTHLTGTWSVHFIEGGPDLPAPGKTTRLQSWTTFGGQEVQNFSGTARYILTFPHPAGEGDGWLLNLGKVCESARMWLNGQNLGTLIGPDYRMYLDGSLLKETNTLRVDVSNLMANRIAYLDRHNIPWKKFYNVNFPARRRENTNAQGLFDASKWPPRDSGLLGPVTLTPVALKQF